MTISPSQVEDHVKEQYRLDELFAEIDSHLLKAGVVASSVCYLRELPNMIAEQVATAYRNVGWKVSFNTVGSERHGPGMTSFVFLK